MITNFTLLEHDGFAYTYFSHVITDLILDKHYFMVKCRIIPLHNVIYNPLSVFTMYKKVCLVWKLSSLNLRLIY